MSELGHSGERAVNRRDEAPPVKKAPGKKAPGKKAPGKKVPGKKVPGKKVPGKKVPGKKVPGKKVPGKKAKGPAERGTKPAPSDRSQLPPTMAVPEILSPTTDPMVVLELTEPYTRAELRRAWRAHAGRHHPDQGGNAQTFARGRVAYEELLSRLQSKDA